MTELQEPPGSEVPLEFLAPRLGDYLLEKGLITPQELQLALDYQKKKAASGQPRLVGRALLELGFIDRATLDQAIASQIIALQNALQSANQQLEQRVQQRTKELELRLSQIRAAAEITRDALAASGLDELLNRTVHLLVERMHYEQASIYLTDETNQQAILYADSSPIGQVQNIRDFRVPLQSNSLIAWVVTNNQIRVIANTSLDPLQSHNEPLNGYHSEVGIPIAFENKVLGVLSLKSKRQNAFDSEEATILQMIADHIATFIKNLRLVEMTQSELQTTLKRLNVLETLNIISKTIAMETDLNNLYHSIHQQIVKVVGEVNFLIALYHPETDIIEIPYAIENGQSLNLSPFPLGEGLTSILIRSRQPLMLVRDTENRARELGAKVVGAPAKSWLGVPLLVGGEVIGALILQDPQRENRFDEDDLLFMSNLASQVAATVRNIRLLEESRRNARRERLVTDISSKVWATTNIHTILLTTLRELGRSLEATEGYIQLEVQD